MPPIDLETAAGPGSFHYTLSTPKETNAKNIVDGIPTLILLHPTHIGSHIFHSVYADPQLRRFNVVSLDLRGHGKTVAPAEDTYGPEVAAGDVLQLMDALKLSACHMTGIAMGASIALQLAILAPERVLSLFMFSPLPLEEPPEASDGRQEIWDCWVAAFHDPEQVDKIALQDAVMGALQLAYNNRETPLTRAMLSKAFPEALTNWGPGNFELFHTVAVKFFLNRAPHGVGELSRIRCPVALVHCAEDVAYPVEHAEELLRLPTTASGGRGGAAETNTLLYEFVSASSSDNERIPPAKGSVESPFQAELGVDGLGEDVDSDSEDESSD
ncbi:Alpha/Beta hydrolase protein [Mycena galericulata]|nr:Alpha/Beta hydrolase protein [Mycena galericulata]